MKKILPSHKIYISESKIPNSGLGVFAKIDIQKGESIENCPIIEIPEPDLQKLGETNLINYFYFFGQQKEKLLVALGFGSIYNHSYTPNAVYKIKPKAKIIEFISKRNIKKDEEITVNYNQSSPKSAPLWFEQ